MTVRKTMNDIVSKVFGDAQSRIARPVSDLLYKDGVIPFLPQALESYIIPQLEEGRMELVATRTLYKQLKTALPKMEELEPIVSFGMGRSSTQFTQFRAAATVDQLPQMDYRMGMDHAGVLFLGEDIVRDYLANPVLLNNFIGLSPHPPLPFL